MFLDKNTYHALENQKQSELEIITKFRIFGGWMGKIKSYKNFKEEYSETLDTLWGKRAILSYMEWTPGIDRNKGTQPSENKGIKEQRDAIF